MFLCARDCYVIVVGPNGKEHQVFVASAGPKLFFGQGWEAFLTDKLFVDGDVIFCVISEDSNRIFAKKCDGSNRTKALGIWQVEDGKARQEVVNARQRHVAKEPEDSVNVSDDEPDIKKPFKVPLLKRIYSSGLRLKEEDHWRMPPRGSAILVHGPDGIDSNLKAKTNRYCLSHNWDLLVSHYSLKVGDILEFQVVGELEWTMNIYRGGAQHDQKKF